MHSSVWEFGDENTRGMARTLESLSLWDLKTMRIHVTLSQVGVFYYWGNTLIAATIGVAGAHSGTPESVS